MIHKYFIQPGTYYCLCGSCRRLHKTCHLSKSRSSIL
uniref:Uncharacterized protein n=1 Tax=Anguilla anguilla TaxID=7936 RepID=A0A0E9TYL0_ANGAN